MVEFDVKPRAPRQVAGDKQAHGVRPVDRLGLLATELNRSPRVVAQRRLAEQLTASWHGGSTPTIQRYSLPETGGKLSQNEQLFLQDGDTLFASQAQFDAANMVETRPVVFEQGAAHADRGALRRVVAAHRGDPPADADSDEARGATVRKVERAEIERRINTHPDTLAAIQTADDMTDEQRQATYEETDLSEIIMMIQMDQGDALRDDITAEVEQSNFAINAPAMARFEEYLAAEQAAIAEGKITSLSDCGEAARELAADQAHILSIAPLDGRAGAAEWEYHHAPIVMQDGDDQVTMESAAARQRDGYSKMERDRSWRFAMYGTAEGQTFEAAHRTDMGGAGD